MRWLVQWVGGAGLLALMVENRIPGSSIIYAVMHEMGWCLPCNNHLATCSQVM